tara:strand:- start:19 stop:477 length:459 start_codon:yes stop_codon:yes gene_type:complete
MKCNKTFLVMGIFLMLSTVSCDFNKDGAEKIKNQKEVNVADNAQQDLENKINQLESDVNNLKTSQSSTDNTAILQELKKILREISILKVSQDKMSKDIAALKTSQGKAKQQQKGKEPTAAQSAVVKNIPIGDSMVLGNPDAPVTIIKWTDFQ